MRADVYVKDVLARCEALKRASMWLPEPKIRPRAWIDNFDMEDRHLAAQLLERFTFYDQRLTDSLLTSSFFSISDGLPKGPRAPTADRMLLALPHAAFTPVESENPNPTDSGYFLCRRARQILAISEEQIKTSDEARLAASNGRPVIFLDDFIGSGDQFLSTWTSTASGKSFAEIQQANGFVAIYVTLVGTQYGIDEISKHAPTVAVCATHKIDRRGTFFGIQDSNGPLFQDLEKLLKKYSTRLAPNDAYMRTDEYLVYGYKNRGMFFGFEHSIPDASLPIFWCRGTNWEPLVERT